MRFSIDGYLHGTTCRGPNKQLDRQKILDREVVVSKSSQDSTQFNSMANSEESELEENNNRARDIYLRTVKSIEQKKHFHDGMLFKQQNQLVPSCLNRLIEPAGERRLLRMDFVRKWSTEASGGLARRSLVSFAQR